MLYYLIPLLICLMATRLADGRLGCVTLLIFGVGMSGLAVFSGFWPLVAALGFGGGLREVAQHSHALRIIGPHADPATLDAGFSVLRLIERVPAILGAALDKSYGYPVAISSLRLTMLAGTLRALLAETANAVLKAKKAMRLPG